MDFQVEVMDLRVIKKRPKSYVDMASVFNLELYSKNFHPNIQKLFREIIFENPSITFRHKKYF